MNAIAKKRVFIFLLAFFCLIFGSIIYVFFRPTTLMMFQWADAFRLTNFICTLRASSVDIGSFLPKWFVFSLPFALWVLAYLLLIEAIWAGSDSFAKLLWFWFVPFISIFAELAQYMHIIKGYFDWVDFAAIIISIITGHITISIFNSKKEKWIHD